MESSDSLVSILGSVASIAGAGWAFYQANNARRSASKAEQIKGELINRRTIVEVSKIHAETNRILKTVSTVGPSCNKSMLRGIDCAAIAKEVEEFCRSLNEQSSHFSSSSFDNEAKRLCSDIQPHIETLSEATNFQDKKDSGKSIYYLINDFLPLIKSLSDDKKENVSAN